MSEITLQTSFDQAAQRFGESGGRRRREDAGRSRLPTAVQSWMAARLAGRAERPNVSRLLRELAAHCRRIGERVPSRATVYAFLERAPTPLHRVDDLPPAVRRALHNLEPESLVPESQIAFYCLNYGDLSALCFAAGLPWLALHQASRARGWRQKSRGVLEAVLSARGR